MWYRLIAPVLLHLQHLMLGATTAAYIASWQFAQFAVFTQVFAVHLVDSLGLLTPRLARRIYTSILASVFGLNNSPGSPNQELLLYCMEHSQASH